MTHRLAIGSVAGAAATIAMQPLRSSVAKRLPSTTPPMRHEPGEFMVQQVQSRLPRRVRDAVPGAVETAAARSLALGYGVTFGALYALMRPRPANIIAEGAALGLGTWAAGYLGWLPATRLMPPITKQTKAQVVTPIAQHIVFGLVAVSAVAALHALRDAVDAA